MIHTAAKCVWHTRYTTRIISVETSVNKYNHATRLNFTSVSKKLYCYDYSVFARVEVYYFVSCWLVYKIINFYE